MRKKKVFKIFSVMVLSLVVLMPVAFALYRNIVTGSGNLSTANWEVSINQINENDYLSVVPGVSESTASYALNITSNSEVDAVYSIVINNLPAGVSVSADDGESFIPAVNNKVIISDAGTILYNGNPVTKRHVLIFKAAAGTTLVNNQAVDVNVIARQSV